MIYLKQLAFFISNEHPHFVYSMYNPELITFLTKMYLLMHFSGL